MSWKVTTLKPIVVINARSFWLCQWYSASQCSHGYLCVDWEGGLHKWESSQRSSRNPTNKPVHLSHHCLGLLLGQNEIRIIINFYFCPSKSTLVTVMVWNSRSKHFQTPHVDGFGMKYRFSNATGSHPVLPFPFQRICTCCPGHLPAAPCSLRLQ